MYAMHSKHVMHAVAYLGEGELAPASPDHNFLLCIFGRFTDFFLQNIKI